MAQKNTDPDLARKAIDIKVYCKLLSDLAGKLDESDTCQQVFHIGINHALYLFEIIAEKEFKVMGTENVEELAKHYCETVKRDLAEIINAVEKQPEDKSPSPHPIQATCAFRPSSKSVSISSMRDPVKVPIRLNTVSGVPRLDKPHISQVLHWRVSCEKINNIIMHRRERHTVECEEEIEVNVGNRSNFKNPKLRFILHPCGIEDDRGKYMTLEVEINMERKAPKLKDSTNVEISLTISIIQPMEIIKKVTKKASFDLEVFYIEQFLSHQILSESSSDAIHIKIQAECIN